MKNNHALFALDYIAKSMGGKELFRTMPSYFKGIEKALRAAEREKERMDWLLDNRDLGVRAQFNGNGGTLWFDTRREVDAAIRVEKKYAVHHHLAAGVYACGLMSSPTSIPANTYSWPRVSCKRCLARRQRKTEKNKRGAR